jgi:glycosyltransferase involved in cell wall biosynthesis
MTISILILTKNEANDLPACLASVAWSDDIHVFDSGSTDETELIAHRGNAKFSKKIYDNKLPFGGDESAHRNWAIKNLPFKYDWIFTIDADERATPELVESMKLAVTAAKDEAAFRIQRRDFFLGTWLRHVQTTPYYLRLFHKNRLHYERVINPVTISNGPVVDIAGYLDHFPFSKGISYWFERHNGYSTAEASQIILNRENKEPFSIKSAFFEKDFNKKRFHQKELFYRLPFRPLIKFIILYVLKRGFLDGKAGFTYAVLQSIYEYMIVIKTRELEMPNIQTSKI